MLKAFDDGRPDHRLVEFLMNEARAGSHPLYGRADNSLLVQVLLAEDDADAAWQAAITDGCTENLWMILARATESSPHISPTCAAGTGAGGIS